MSVAYADLPDDAALERRLTCDHGDEWRPFESSLSRLWCRECDGMVAVEFRTADGHDPVVV